MTDFLRKWTLLGCRGERARRRGWWAGSYEVARRVSLGVGEEAARKVTI